jgi:hypothetical protein
VGSHIAQRWLSEEACLTLEIPQSVVLLDGTTAVVRGVAAQVIDGTLQQIVYTVEKQSGAWTDVAGGEVHTPDPQVRDEASAASRKSA